MGRDSSGHAGSEPFPRSSTWFQILESFVRNASEAIVITEGGPIDSPGPRILYVNQAFSAITGYSPEEVVGKNPRLLQGPNTDRGALDRIREALAKEEPCTAELINYRKDGTEFWTDICIVPIRDGNGRATHWVASKRDVTSRKVVEQALRRSEALNKALLDAIPDLMFRLDRSGVFLDYRPAKEIEPLVPPEDFLGKSIPEVLPTAVADKCMSSLVRALENRETQACEYQLPVPGGVRDYEARIVVCGENEVVSIVRDITDRKLHEQQTRQASKMEALGRLAGGVAHDFNNLLTVIGGYARMALGSLAVNDPLWEDLGEIAKATDRAASLTQHLLAFSRHHAAQPKVLDLNSVVSGMDKLLRRLIGAQVKLVTVLRPNLKQVKCEPSQLEQVLMNLIVNCVDAMEGGGRITIETGNVELSEEYSRTHIGVQTGSYVMLAVADSGRGMTPETKAHLFEPFFTTKELGKGTGLGLATVYGIVKQSGGEIDVDSELGGGTTIRIYLPAVQETELAAEPDALVRRPLKGSETVLLVEDEAGVRRFLKEVLLQQGYRVLEARDGREALRISTDHPEPINLLLTDVVMPEMTGGELARRARGLRPELKVLYVSGFPDDASLPGEAAAGSSFLQKPFSPEALLRKLRDVLDLANSPSQDLSDPSAR